MGRFVELEVGELTKRFRLIGDAYYLEQVRSGPGDLLRFDYDGTRIVRVATTHGRFVRLRRDGAGRIMHVEDDRSGFQQRTTDGHRRE